MHTPLNVKVFVADDLSDRDFYLTYEVPRDSELHVVVNMAHPYLTQITGSADGLANYLRQCIFDAIAEHKTYIQRGTIHSNTVRFWKDHLLRIPLILDEDDGDHPDDMLTEEEILPEI